MQKLFLFACLVISVSSEAQDYPAFGTPIPEELRMMECPFDKDAVAYVLLDEGKSDNDDFKLSTSRRIRIKILKEKGLEYANISIRYYSKDDFEQIRDVQGMVMNLEENGNITYNELSNKDIFDRKLDQYYSEVSFSLPGVKVGSVIEYRYRSIQKSYDGLDDWYFQRELPVRISKYDLAILPNAEFSYVVRKKSEYPITVKPDQRRGSIFFEMKNIPGLRYEPMMDAPRDYLQRVEFQLYSYNQSKYIGKWVDISRELMGASSFGIQLNKKLDGTSEIIDKANNLPNDYEKMKFIYKTVCNTMKWNGYYGKYSADGIRKAWNTGTASAGDINLILINLLQSAGLETYPVLVSERKHGEVNPNTPIMDQFNKVVACVNIGNQKYFLDATLDNYPPYLIPETILNTKGYLVDRKKGSLIDIADNSRSDWTTIILNGKITTEMKLEGKASIKTFDYARVETESGIKKDKRKFIEGAYQDNMPGLQIDSFALVNAETDSAGLEQNLNFSLPLMSSGDYYLLNLNVFSGLYQNPFIADERFTDINMGARRLTQVYFNFSFPPNAEPEGLPKDIILKDNGGNIIFVRNIKINKVEKAISVQISIAVNKTYFPNSDYGVIKEFYKKMYDLLKEQVVFKKKS